MDSLPPNHKARCWNIRILKGMYLEVSISPQKVQGKNAWDFKTLTQSMSMAQEPTGLNLKTENHENSMYRGAWWATYSPWDHRVRHTVQLTLSFSNHECISPLQDYSIHWPLPTSNKLGNFTLILHIDLGLVLKGLKNRMLPSIIYFHRGSQALESDFGLNSDSTRTNPRIWKVT